MTEGSERKFERERENDLTNLKKNKGTKMKNRENNDIHIIMHG